MIQTFLVEPEDLFAATYVFLEETNRVCLVAQDHGRERINRRATIPHMVVADRVEAGSVLSPEGEIGTHFVLFEHDLKVASVEVYADRLVLVHASYSKDAVNAGSVPPSTRLVFRAEHHNRMLEAMAEVEMDPELTYVPSTEVLWSPRARRLFAGGGTAGEVWDKACAFLTGMNASVVRAIDTHNSLEFLSAGILPNELPTVSLGAIFGS